MTTIRHSDELVAFARDLRNQPGMWKKYPRDLKPASATARAWKIRSANNRTFGPGFETDVTEDGLLVRYVDDPLAARNSDAKTGAALDLIWDRALQRLCDHVGERVTCTGGNESGTLVEISGRWAMVAFGDTATPLKVCPANLRLPVRSVTVTTSPLAVAGSTPP